MRVAAQHVPRLRNEAKTRLPCLGTTSVSLKFTVTGGTAQIDDVFVDPIKEV